MGLIGTIEEGAANAIVPGSGALVHIWLWCRKHWQTLVVVAAVFALALTIWRAPWAEARQRDKDQAQITALQKTVSDMQAASAKAEADNKAHVAATEAADEQTRKVQTDALSAQLVDAHAALAGWLRSQAAAHNAGGNGVPQTPGSASSVDGAGQSAVVSVPDLEICAENTVKAQGWQDWYKAVSANPR